MSKGIEKASFRVGKIDAEGAVRSIFIPSDKSLSRFRSLTTLSEVAAMSQSIELSTAYHHQRLIPASCSAARATC